MAISAHLSRNNFLQTAQTSALMCIFHYSTFFYVFLAAVNFALLQISHGFRQLVVAYASYCLSVSFDKCWVAISFAWFSVYGILLFCISVFSLFRRPEISTIVDVVSSVGCVYLAFLCGIGLLQVDWSNPRSVPAANQFYGRFFSNTESEASVDIPNANYSRPNHFNEMMASPPPHHADNGFRNSFKFWTSKMKEHCDHPSLFSGVGYVLGDSTLSASLDNTSQCSHENSAAVANSVHTTQQQHP